MFGLAGLELGELLPAEQETLLCKSAVCKVCRSDDAHLARHAVRAVRKENFLCLSKRRGKTGRVSRRKRQRFSLATCLVVIELIDEEGYLRRLACLPFR